MPKILGWGSVQYGQLGIGGIEESALYSPRVLANLQSESWQSVSCGYRHTVFVAKHGEIYSCGNNFYGQLGQTLSEVKPERVSFPTSKSMAVRQICSGTAHNLAATTVGEVYCWGSNENGQLGLGSPKQTYSQAVPKLMEFPNPIKVIQVACGDNHSMALSDVGAIYIWGHNSFNQLGLGLPDKFTHKPECLRCLEGLPIRQIACGGNHSFALTQSGAVFGWGRNTFGQLGVGHDKDCRFPVQCRSLRSQKVKYIACGEDHTAVLTKDGGVFTFGASMYGQLGHSSKNNETLPRKVFELMGSKVTQIACGRCHTIALVGDSGRLFSFGTGGLGQLGAGKDDTNATSPLPVQGHWVPYSKHQPMEVSKTNNSSTSYVINKIFTGGDHCFLIASEAEERIEPADFREIIPEQQFLTISSQLIEQVSKINPSGPPPEQFLALIEKIFSSPSCLNASFLLNDDQHYNCSGRHSGVDIDGALRTFSTISSAGNAVLNQRVYACLEGLLQRLNSSPPDVEALRLYLTIPQCRLFDNPTNNNSLIVRFGEAVLGLVANAGKVVDNWWSKLQTQHFTRLIDIHKKLVNYILDLPTNVAPEKFRGLYSTMEILKKLNAVNLLKCQVVSYDYFYIPELKDRLNIQQDYIRWIQSQHLNQNHNVLIFCNYPFALDAQAKTILLQTDAHIQMRTAVEEVAQRNLATLTFAGFIPMVDVINPCLVLHIQRHNLLNDTITQLTKYGNADLKKPLKVTFAEEEALDAGGVRKVIFRGEEAVDEGGVRKEFFMLLMREILDPQYGMFKYYEESRLIWFRQQLEDNDRYMFLLVGQVCGLAIYNSTIIDLSFPLVLYKKLLQKPVTLEDLKELEPQLGRGLEQMIEYDGEDFEDIFPCTFEIDCDIYGHVEKMPLVDNGANIKVTKDNKKEFVDAYVNYVFNKSVKTQFEDFNTGFQKVIGSRVLEFFHPKELQAMVVGNENYDFQELEKNCQYKGVYHANHETIKFFWDVFHAMEIEDKKKFLLFLTGSDRIPILGMKALPMIIQPTLGGITYLPVAHTCFNLLDLPIYNKKEIVKEKLLKAIQQTEGFGIV